MDAAGALLLGLPGTGQEDNREREKPHLLRVSFKSAGRGNPCVNWVLKVLSLCPDVLGDLEER